ncbi:NUDIX domain-containing protein [Zhihengliuella sp.]|uniref:(deoxy)nucleoside triphosphate pyrophosphohydrolase n=1 Tax=Zhihengliuella sp. TaxID=1954483 RepID=UPI002810C895|nr:NUDIX domain-containing protein [Zhihengliuella sp.]
MHDGGAGGDADTGERLRQIVGAALVDRLEAPTRLLVARRTRPAALAGLWEFAGGKVDPGETCEQALVRELAEELGVTARLGAEIAGPLAQGWPLAGRAAMRVWFAEADAGQPLPREDHDLLRWLPLDRRALAVDWIPADLPIVEALLDQTS